jgi:hypothetical protein
MLICLNLITNSIICLSNLNVYFPFELSLAVVNHVVDQSIQDPRLIHDVWIFLMQFELLKLEREELILQFESLLA